MARITDPSKLENIKRAVKELVVENGYHGVSTSMIAERAEVSMGYLYRHYDGKDELLQSIVETDFMPWILEIHSAIKEIKHSEENLKKVIRKVLEVGEKNQIGLCFLFRLYIEDLFGVFDCKDEFKEKKEIREKILKDEEFETKLLRPEEGITLMFMTIMSLVLNRYKHGKKIKDLDYEVERTTKLVMAISKAE